MSTSYDNVGEVLIRLYAIAHKLEGEGQYNVAKLTRASADSLLRSGAYPLRLSSDRDQLATEVQAIAERIGQLGVKRELVESLRTGASAISEGRLPLIGETPHPYVCRTCGHIEMGIPKDKCKICNAHPGTFQGFPPVYWLEAMDPFDALEHLQSTPDEVLSLIEGIEDSDLTREIAEGEWSIRETLTHLRDAQQVLDYRVNLLLEEEDPTIESQAVFEWARDDSGHPLSAMQIFEDYRSSRQKTVATLQKIPLADWWREGFHEEFGRVSIQQQASYFATHELTHLPQIETLRERLLEAGR